MGQRAASFLAAILVASSGTAHAQVPREIVRSYLWPESSAEFERAVAAAESPQWVGVSRSVMLDVVEFMREGRFGDAAALSEAAPRPPDGRVRLAVEAPGGRTIPALVALPARYDPGVAWPLILAMHGGPPGSAEGAERGAARMIDVWSAADRAGWIVVAPAMTEVVARDERTEDRLPYEIFHPEEARAVVDAVRERFNVDPDRVVSTGISLGSNFSIAFAAAHPDWLSAIVPVSTEGESREHLLRNLTTPTYVLEGALDRNIRGASGPRAMRDILTFLGYDIVYREFADRAHEGFQEHYPDVLRWLATRPRGRTPREVLRVPHDGIVPVARRVHWLESDTRQGLVHANVARGNVIDAEARWAGALTFHLSDELLDLDAPVRILVNGVEVFRGRVQRSLKTALEEARELRDPRRVYAARVTVDVPRSEGAVERSRAFTRGLEPERPAGRLSFWEMYAVRALEERWNLGFEGEPTRWPDAIQAWAPEQVALLVSSVDAESPWADAGLRAGDVLISFGDEPFFEGRAHTERLEHWLIRELRGHAQRYAVRVLRDGIVHVLSTELALGPYRSPDG